MSLSPLARSALAYADVLGWSVFPLNPRSKVPNGLLAPNGHLAATSDIERIAAWWQAAPDSNIGLRPTDWFVVDVDPRSDGDSTLHALESEHGALPHTPRALTGGGGEHILFKVPPGVSKFVGKLGQGIEIKSASGYIVAPPSKHPQGRDYLWDAGAHPLDMPVNDAPEWLLSRVVAQSGNGTFPKPVGAVTDSFLFAAFEKMGWVGKQLPSGALAVRCPNFAQHTDGRGNGDDSSTVIMAPTTDAKLGAFRCAHSHCSHIHTMAAVVMLDVKAIEVAAAKYPTAFAQAVHRLRRGSKR